MKAIKKKKTLKIQDKSQVSSSEHVLLGHRGSRKPARSGIVYSSYIPVCEVLTLEESARRHKAKVAGKQFAKVSLKHPDGKVRGKKGLVVGKKVEDGVKKVCVRIEKTNWCFENGRMTWIGVSEKDRSDEWVEESLISQVWKYDTDGNEVDINDKPIVSDGCKSEISEARTTYGKVKQKQ